MVAQSQNGYPDSARGGATSALFMSSFQPTTKPPSKRADEWWSHCVDGVRSWRDNKNFCECFAVQLIFNQHTDIEHG